MTIFALFASLFYLVVGLGFASLTLHELATARRDRVVNRLFAWSSVVLWLPILVAAVIGAAVVSPRMWKRQSVPVAGPAVTPTAAPARNAARPLMNRI